MKHWIGCAVVAAAAGLGVAASAAAGEITLYETLDFAGLSIAVRQAAPDLERIGFNDRASSMVIRSGVWELCTDAYFQGRCERFGPGSYDTLGELIGKISSLREVAGSGPAYATPAHPGPGADRGGAPRIQLFETRNFGGRSITLTYNVSDFERIGFNARADAAIIRGGVWRLCTDARMRGDCRDFPPGRYNDLGPLGGKVSSARIVQ